MVLHFSHSEVATARLITNKTTVFSSRSQPSDSGNQTQHTDMDVDINGSLLLNIDNQLQVFIFLTLVWSSLEKQIVN